MPVPATATTNIRQRLHRRKKQEDLQRSWENPEDELLGGVTAWRNAGEGSGSRSTGLSSMSETASARMSDTTTTHARKKLGTISDNINNNHKSEISDEGGKPPQVYNDTTVSRRQPWRSRYPTPHDLKEQLAAQRIDGAQDV